MAFQPLRVQGIRRGARLKFEFNGVYIDAFDGEFLSTALIASGIGAWRQSWALGAPRGLYCAMGMCFDCLVAVEGRGLVRACNTTVQDGMRAWSVGQGGG
jgi:sarcosine oxidase subunit alpha